MGADGASQVHTCARVVEPGAGGPGGLCTAPRRAVSRRLLRTVNMEQDGVCKSWKEQAGCVGKANRNCKQGACLSPCSVSRSRPCGLLHRRVICNVLCLCPARPRLCSRHPEGLRKVFPLCARGRTSVSQGAVLRGGIYETSCKRAGTASRSLKARDVIQRRVVGSSR